MFVKYIDIALTYASNIAWIVLGIYVLIFFIRSLLKSGPVKAFVRLFSFRVLFPLLLVLGLSILSYAIVYIDPPEVGVVPSVISPRGIRPRALPSGLHLIFPFLETVIRYPIYWQTYTMSNNPEEGQRRGDDSIRARTSDQQEVLIDCSVIFQIDPEQAVLVHVGWQERYMRDFIRPLTRSLVRTQVSQLTVNEVNGSARPRLEATLNRLLQEELADKGFTLDQFLLRDITFTPEFAQAVERKQVALEGAIERQYQADQIRNLAQGRADAILIEAQAQADALTLIAQSLEDNPELLTYHYIDRLSPNIRAMLIPSENPLILPLPNVLEASGALTSTTSLQDTSPFTSTLTPGIQADLETP